MARGLYRDQQGDVMVQYDQYQKRIPRGTYIVNGYQPIYDELPAHETYNDAPHAPQKAASTVLEKEVEKTPQERSF
jgi:hypothetical protein